MKNEGNKLKRKKQKKLNKSKALFNPNSSKIKVPNFKNNKIKANIKKRLDYNIKYNLNNITGKEKDKNLTYCEDQTKYKEEPKKINETLPKENLNKMKKSMHESKLYSTKINKTKNLEKAKKTIVKKKLNADDINIKRGFNNVMNKQNKKSSENSLIIKKDKKNHHSPYEIKGSSDSLSNFESVFKAYAKTEYFTSKNGSQESKTDKNPSEIPEKYIEFVRKENLELIKTFMKEARKENKISIKLFAKEIVDNLADKLAVVLKNSNADLVKGVVEKMKNK